MKSHLTSRETKTLPPARTEPLNIGDRIKDNDPRMKGRTLTIASLSGDYVYAGRSPTGQQLRILRRRIFTDGKARRSGFSLVTP